MNVDAFMDCSSFVVTLVKGDVRRELLPKFIVVRDELKQYIDEFDSDALLFAGWRPYKSFALDVFTNSLRFKDFLINNGIATPEYSNDPEAEMFDVLVKPIQSTFGMGIRGPFKQSQQVELDRHHEYYEKFILGSIVKIWCWNRNPVCFELQPMPQICGDGIKTIDQIIRQRVFIRGTTINYCDLNQVLSYFGRDKNDVIKKNTFQMVDFRYGSPLARRNAINEVTASAQDFPEVQRQIAAIVPAVWQLVQSQYHGDLVFTIDAILDEAHKLWVLEANINPMVHPLVYPIMIDDMFSNEMKTEGATSHAGIQ